MPPHFISHFMENRTTGHRFSRPGDVAEREDDERSVDERSIDERSVDERSITADSWSVKSEYGSTLDGEDPRHAEVDVMATVEDRAATGGEEIGEEEKANQDGEEGSVLGLRSYWDSTYSDELANFHEHGQSGEIWFGETVMETSAEWIVSIAAAVESGASIDPVVGMPLLPAMASQLTHSGKVTKWKTLDIGTGNGLLLHQLAKHGLSDLTGTDYCEAAVELARAVAQRAGLACIQFLVDDILDSRLEGQYDLVTDKGTLDAVKLHLDGVDKMCLYRKSVERVVAPGGLLVVTSCNSTKDELIEDIVGPIKKAEVGAARGLKAGSDPLSGSLLPTAFEFVDYLRTYPSYRFGGAEGTRVCTVAFRRCSS